MDNRDKTKYNRRDFDKGSLNEVKYDDPMLMFNEWYQEAHEKQCADPHAFVLGTVNEASQPSSRIVYLRDVLEEGIVFYTNYLSRKGKESSNNPKVSGLFYWDCCERQVRIEGELIKVPEEMSDDYFNSRPRMSQIGAWASNQSQTIHSREELELKVKEFEAKYKEIVPRPPHWGGYVIQPTYFEFWQGRLGRLHDRFCFKIQDDNWIISRISP